MLWIIFTLGMAQCVFLWILCRTGMNLRKKAEAQQAAVMISPPMRWPFCSMLIPLGGLHSQTKPALLSLLQQDYPNFQVCIITAAGDKRAEELLSDLKELFPDMMHVTAPAEQGAGQKNINLLAGIESVSPDTEVLVFCDSTHLARPDFLRCLVYPVARGEYDFATGYHQVIPGDQRIFTLGYALNVLFMRLLQGLGNFTQPWGGAMAIRAEAFARHHIARLWQDNVVDDCSLAGKLAQEKLPICLCPGALLDTTARHGSLSTWNAWLTRQILFLKFCMPEQWLALGFMCLWMLVPPVWCGCSLFLGLVNVGSGLTVTLAMFWLILSAWSVTSWRDLVPAPACPSRWYLTFICSCILFMFCYLRSIFARHILWQGIEYEVGKGGRVTGTKNMD